ncbi:LysR family transcriptional regulator [Candidimonas nitroreducens]|uniref:LysR family transcriptional regulator n=1 Tax=Candidimonas nitroreducens TaxID=683354 RepID=UPI001E3806B3|nr:LysR family transcriptional regulator [Candidimonas nitroreducens]
MTLLFDLRLLRAFVAIVDAGSFTAAADRLHMTQSTISQQIARLEESVGHQLVDRGARPILATASGERLLGYARRILMLESEAHVALGDPAGASSVRIGLPEDIFSGCVAAIFKAFAATDSSIRLDITTGLSRALAEQYRGGEFDIVVVKEPAASADCFASFPEPMAWFESSGAVQAWCDPIPLVAFPPEGLYREAMFDRIERERRRWYIAFSGSSLQSVLVGVEAGLGLSLLPVQATKGRRLRIYEPFGMAPSMAVSIYTWDKSGLACVLAGKMAAALGNRQFS